MELQCKIAGESLRNRDVVSEDRISELPEALLLEILSLLPTEVVISTSVLSKRWRSLWKMVPNLNFGSKYHHTLSENVGRALSSHEAPVLDSLHLRVEDEGDMLSIWIGIGIAIARHVRELVLCFWGNPLSPTTFPSVLCRCTNNIETLKLEFSIVFDLRSPVCFKYLRKLHLYYVGFEDEESLCNLFRGCPRLEDLFVRRTRDDVETFTIAVPSLQRLTIEDDCTWIGDGGYVINTPALKYLNIKWFGTIKFCLIENPPELVEAKVTDVTNADILESLTSTKCLSLALSPLEVNFPTGKNFDQLVCLELHTNKRKWWNLLTLMLDASPKLQILKLKHTNVSNFISQLLFSGSSLHDQKWNQPKRVPECLLFHLETFVWTGYNWNQGDEKNVATYILENARLLKKATFSTKPSYLEKLEGSEKRLEMLNELASVVRASDSCHLEF